MEETINGVKDSISGFRTLVKSVEKAEEDTKKDGNSLWEDIKSIDSFLKTKVSKVAAAQKENSCATADVKREVAVLNRRVERLQEPNDSGVASLKNQMRTTKERLRQVKTEVETVHERASSNAKMFTSVLENISRYTRDQKDCLRDIQKLKDHAPPLSHFLDRQSASALQKSDKQCQAVPDGNSVSGTKDSPSQKLTSTSTSAVSKVPNAQTSRHYPGGARPKQPLATTDNHLAFSAPDKHVSALLRPAPVTSV